MSIIKQKIPTGTMISSHSDYDKKRSLLIGVVVSYDTMNGYAVEWVFSDAFNLKKLSSPQDGYIYSDIRKWAGNYKKLAKKIRGNPP